MKTSINQTVWRQLRASIDCTAWRLFKKRGGRGDREGGKREEEKGRILDFGGISSAAKGRAWKTWVLVEEPT